MAKQLTKEILKRGDIIGYHFGYSMTFYDAYQVIAIKGSTIQIIPAKREIIQSGWQPIVKFSKRNSWLQKEVITKRFNKYGQITLGGTGRYGHTAFICEKDETFQEDHWD